MKSKSFSKTVGLPFESFWHYEIHNFWLKIVICPLLYINFFQNQAFFRKTEGFLHKAFHFGPVRQKNRQTGKIFRYRISFETQKCSPTNFNVTVRKSLFNGVWWYPILMHNILRYTFFSETPNCSPTKFLGSVRQKVLKENRTTPSFAQDIESSGGIVFCRKLSLTRIWTVVSLITVGKCWSKRLFSCKKMPVIAGRLVFFSARLPTLFFHKY